MQDNQQLPSIGDSASPRTPSDRGAAAVEFLLGRINYERVATAPYSERHLKLDRMRTLLHRLGNPGAGMPIVHIAGTKGKGSTSAMLAAILHAAGYDVGVYSSPHLENLEERFCINGQPCSSQELVDLVDRLRPTVAQMDEAARVSNDFALRPTFFELTTAMALMHFADRRVDAVILEVGLGGRLDSTNVCQPVVSVITSISLDHVRQLGDTTAKIAAEKGGIIKPGTPVLVGPMDDSAREVLIELARQRGCRLIESPRDFQFTYSPPRDVETRGAHGRINYRSHAPDDPLELFETPLAMLGGHQAANAALAVTTALELRRQGWLISTDAIRQGLQLATLAGRIEVVGKNPTIILDVAHNVASVAALVDCIRESFVSSNRVLLLAASRDKDVRGMIRVLIPNFDRVVVTEYKENPRAVPVEQLRAWCDEELKRLGRTASPDQLQAYANPVDAWRAARDSASDNDLTCVTGSFFIVAELRRLATSACA